MWFLSIIQFWNIFQKKYYQIYLWYPLSSNPEAFEKPDTKNVCETFSSHSSKNFQILNSKKVVNSTKISDAPRLQIVLVISDTRLTFAIARSSHVSDNNQLLARSVTAHFTGLFACSSPVPCLFLLAYSSQNSPTARSFIHMELTKNSSVFFLSIYKSFVHDSFFSAEKHKNQWKLFLKNFIKERQKIPMKQEKKLLDNLVKVSVLVLVSENTIKYKVEHDPRRLVCQKS